MYLPASCIDIGPVYIGYLVTLGVVMCVGAGYGVGGSFGGDVLLVVAMVVVVCIKENCSSLNHSMTLLLWLSLYEWAIHYNLP